MSFWSFRTDRSRQGRVVLPLFLLLLIAAPLSATTVVPLTDRELLARSAVVVHGTVLSSEVVEGPNGYPETISVIEPLTVLKGELPGNLTVRQAGGTLPDGRFFKLWGRPEYVPGSEVIVFAIREKTGDYQTAEMLLGKFEVWRDAKGESFARPDLSIRANPEVEILERTNNSSGSLELDSLAPARKLNRFLEFLANGGTADTDMSGAPVGAMKPVRHDNSSIVTPQWAPIGSLWRYNNNATAGWQTDGVANGGRGVSESQNALAIWTNDPTSTINFSMGGSNQIHLDALTSPCGWDTALPAGLGVVGCGGPKGGGTHTHREETWWTITGGEVWLRRFSSPNQLSSALIQAILVHELGHSLGLGHSDQDASPHDTCRGDESSAIMRSTVGSNSSLGSDDQDAARWLYGDGSKSCGGGAPPTCTAPSITSHPQSSTINAGQAAPLSVAASGTATVTYQWYQGGSGNTSQPIPGATNASINVAPSVTSSYWARASNSCGTANSNTATITVNSGPPPPPPLIANFTVSQATGIAGQTPFVFTDASSGEIASRVWNFGDGQTSTAVSPTHVFSSPGGYNITLVVYGPQGNSSQNKYVSVIAPAPGVNAAFTYTPANPTTDTQIQFSDTSSGGPTSWAWNFGDGTSSTQRNPAKNFVSPGTYLVTLTASNGTSSSASSQNVTVAASTPALPNVNAEFDVSNITPGVLQLVAFTDRSSGSPNAWSWSFGDGQTSNQPNPSHAYAGPGTYTVSLTASNGSSSGSRTKTLVVTPPAAERFRSLVPVTTQTSGQGSTFWRTELTMFNPGTQWANVTLTFVPGAGGPSIAQEFVLPAGGTASYANALPELFGISSGSGALAVEASNPTVKPQLRVSSRTFTTSPFGTYGQYVPDVEELPAVTFLTGIQANANFRTNIGLVNKSGSAVNTTLTLIDKDGNVLGTNTIAVPGNNFQQLGLVALFPQLQGQSHSGLSMKVQAAVDGAVSCYASTIDNRTQDPIFYPATPAPAGKEVLIPAVARIPGAGGTFWRSDVTILNPTLSTMNLSFRLFVANVDNRNAQAKNLSLPPGRTITIEDIITWMGAGNSNGALLITSTGANVGPIVNSRTYTSREGDSGTFGQWIDSTETAKFGREAIVTGLRADGDFRTNLGFVNNGDGPIGVVVRLYNSISQEIASGFVTVLPKSQTQASVAQMFPHLNVQALGSITMRATTDTGPTLYAYGSVIDNRSGDPIFIRGK